MCRVSLAPEVKHAEEFRRFIVVGKGICGKAWGEESGRREGSGSDCAPNGRHSCRISTLMGYLLEDVE